MNRARVNEGKSPGSILGLSRNLAAGKDLVRREVAEELK
jgi:hypothetical protein